MQHANAGRSFDIEEILAFPKLTKNEARAVEQYLIDYYGGKQDPLSLKEEGLQNLRNEISKNRDIFNGTQEFAKGFLETLGYTPATK